MDLDGWMDGWVDGFGMALDHWLGLDGFLSMDLDGYEYYWMDLDDPSIQPPQMEVREVSRGTSKRAGWN